MSQERIISPSARVANTSAHTPDSGASDACESNCIDSAVSSEWTLRLCACSAILIQLEKLIVTRPKPAPKELKIMMPERENTAGKNFD
ncbi:uncharacterized protein N7511_001253 [Penicillium nucicola]|uniref:uncharacterized protein n=1 Tax=Penicillium nucicola TaxID=1850975 RepID=UPI002544D773|nr:uncharacterized protein N7511_001253 [Penicillium nucicola]KAJ5776242.1 hypothetical protein N7511_001253 [Penicillium nucicola]